MRYLVKEYLSAHPDVVTHPQLEFSVFSRRVRKGHSELTEAEQLDKLVSAAWDRLTLAKHASAYSEPFALDRLSRASPNCKLLLILRDPVVRAHSAFRMELLRGEAEEPFDEVVSRVIEMDREGEKDWRARAFVHLYLHMGLYGKWLGEILNRFPEDNVKVLFLEELRKDPEVSFGECCNWLGLSAGFTPDLEAKHNVGAHPRSALLALRPSSA